MFLRNNAESDSSMNMRLYETHLAPLMYHLFGVQLSTAKFRVAEAVDRPRCERTWNSTCKCGWVWWIQLTEDTSWNYLLFSPLSHSRKFLGWCWWLVKFCTIEPFSFFTAVFLALWWLPFFLFRGDFSLIFFIVVSMVFLHNVDSLCLKWPYRSRKGRTVGFPDTRRILNSCHLSPLVANIFVVTNRVIVITIFNRSHETATMFCQIFPRLTLIDFSPLSFAHLLSKHVFLVHCAFSEFSFSLISLCMSVN